MNMLSKSLLTVFFTINVFGNEYTESKKIFNEICSKHFSRQQLCNVDCFKSNSLISAKSLDGFIRQIQWSTNGEFIIASTAWGQINIYSKQGKYLNSIDVKKVLGEEINLLNFDIDYDGKQVLFVLDSGEIVVVSLENSQIVSLIKSNASYAIFFDKTSEYRSDGQEISMRGDRKAIIAYSSVDKTIKTYTTKDKQYSFLDKADSEFKTEKAYEQVKILPNYSSYTIFSFGRFWLLAKENDKSCKLMDMRKIANKIKVEAFVKYPCDYLNYGEQYAFLPDGEPKIAIAGGFDFFRGMEKAFNHKKISNFGTHAVLIENTIKIYANYADANKHKIKKEIDIVERGTVLSFSPDGLILAVGTQGGRVLFFDTKKWTLLNSR